MPYCASGGNGFGSSPPVSVVGRYVILGFVRVTVIGANHARGYGSVW